MGEEGTHGEGCSTALLLTLGAGKSWGALLHVVGGGVISIPGLCPPDASDSYPIPSCDNQVCLQVLPRTPYPNIALSFSKYIL